VDLFIFRSRCAPTKKKTEPTANETMKHRTVMVVVTVKNSSSYSDDSMISKDRRDTDFVRGVLRIGINVGMIMFWTVL
jgi:hypothetical protein